jgi:hypothetical protein
VPFNAGASSAVSLSPWIIQDRALDLLERRHVFRAWLSRVVPLVIVEHRAEAGATECLDVLRPGIRIFHPGGETFRREHFLKPASDIYIGDSLAIPAGPVLVV